MKPYLITTGLLFAAIAITHTYLAIRRDHVHYHEILLVVFCAGLALWAGRLFKRLSADQRVGETTAP
jgi:hypothetical protein